MTCYNEKCNYFSWEYVGNPGRVPTCNKNKVLEVFDCSNCKFNFDNVPKEIKDISKWAMDGFDLAEKNGRSIDDLIVYLKTAYGMKMVFDAIKKLPKDGPNDTPDNSV